MVSIFTCTAHQYSQIICFENAQKPPSSDRYIFDVFSMTTSNAIISKFPFATLTPVSHGVDEPSLHIIRTTHTELNGNAA